VKKVSVYALSTCPWCMKTKEYFEKHHIPFESTDYDLADEGTQAKIVRELDAAGASGFPFVRIGDDVVEGYQPARFAELLEIRAPSA